MRSLDDTGASPVLSYIQTDHLGTPQKITDGSAAVVWDGAFDPFGNAASITGSITNNLRFPGQYFDAESGLSQSWNRDYDPTIGRYIESDPIGIVGDLNTYNYGAANPLTQIDPRGLYGLLDALFDFNDLSAGFYDTISFGLTSYMRQAFGIEQGVDPCTPIYEFGEYGGITFDIAYGGMAGLEAAGVRGTGKEFSHWLPKRLGGSRSLFNGQYVSIEEHALTDPFRYRFMKRIWKEANPINSPAYRQWRRIPLVYKGAGAGAAAGAAASQVVAHCRADCGK